MDGKRKGVIFRRIFAVIEIALICLFGFILVCNLIIIIKSAIDPDVPPALFGVMPMAVKSGSMSGDAPDHIEVDDLIFVRSMDCGELETGDIIAYMDENRTVITHRIVAIEEDEGGGRRFLTKGDANNSNDEPVAENDVIGIYWFRVPKLGRVVIFLQTPFGIVLALGAPILIFLGIDFVLRIMKKKTDSAEGESVEKEKSFS